MGCTGKARVEPVYTPAEVAEHLRVSVPMVTKMLRSGEIRGIKAGKLWRVPESALAEFVSSRTTA